jgi:hypothetical protein
LKQQKQLVAPAVSLVNIMGLPLPECLDRRGHVKLHLKECLQRERIPIAVWYRSCSELPRIGWGERSSSRRGSEVQAICQDNRGATLAACKAFTLHHRPVRGRSARLAAARSGVSAHSVARCDAIDRPPLRSRLASQDEPQDLSCASDRHCPAGICSLARLCPCDQNKGRSSLATMT